MSLRFQPAMSRPAPDRKRREARARLAIEGMLDTVHGTSSGYILNLSCNGAMVQTLQPPVFEACVVLRCGPLDVLGIVVWAEDERIGIRFDEPVDEAVVVSLRRLAEQAAREQVWGRPTLRTRTLTSSEWQTAREWSASNLWR